MPRLRYKKDYEGLSHDAATWTQPEDEIYTSEGERGSGASWLSNANIIASLTDAKLRAAIDYHRTILRILEQEQLARLTTGRKARVVDYHFGHGTESTRTTTSNSRSRKGSKGAKQAKLIKQILDAGVPLEAIHKILGII